MDVMVADVVETLSATPEVYTMYRGKEAMRPHRPAFEARLAAFRNKMREAKLDGFIVAHPANRRYLIGYTGGDMPPAETAGFLIVSATDAILVTDVRYTEHAATEAPNIEVVEYGRGMFVQTIGVLLRTHGLRRVGFESRAIIYDDVASIYGEVAGRVELVPQTAFVDGLRLIKDAEELALLRRAISISDQAFNAVRRLLQPGMTERDVAWQIERHMREFGAEAPSFDTIVGSGPNGAMAHAVPSERAIAEGEPIVIDMGARYAGYCSDMTRTVFLGTPDARYRDIYNTVLEAQARATAATKPGATGKAVDAVARDFINSTTYAGTFGHGLGHGIGLMVHELPNLNTRADDQVLAAGMVHSVEPGIYIEGWGGVRIEDLVLVTADGCETLSHADKDPRWEL